MRSHTYSDLSVLLRSDFGEVAKLSPQLATMLQSMADKLRRDRENTASREGGGDAAPAASRWSMQKKSILALTKKVDTKHKLTMHRESVMHRQSSAGHIAGRSSARQGSICRARKSLMSPRDEVVPKGNGKRSPSIIASMRRGSSVPLATVAPSNSPVLLGVCPAAQRPGLSTPALVEADALVEPINPVATHAMIAPPTLGRRSRATSSNLESILDGGQDEEEE